MMMMINQNTNSRDQRRLLTTTTTTTAASTVSSTKSQQHQHQQPSYVLLKSAGPVTSGRPIIQQQQQQPRPSLIVETEDEGSNLSIASSNFDYHQNTNSRSADSSGGGGGGGGGGLVGVAALRERGNEAEVPCNNSMEMRDNTTTSTTSNNCNNNNDNNGGGRIQQQMVTADMDFLNQQHQQVPIIGKCGEDLELRILRQPEEQHRARYMSEGSRGSVKDRSGKSHCTIALRGYNRPVLVDIFAATGGGQVAPHPLYRLIPVTGKNGSSVTTCKQSVTAEDGISCLQVVLRPENKMTAVLDCIGILKICSYDLKRKLPKQNRSPSVRLVFRVTIPAGGQDRGQQHHQRNITLETVSLPIVCAQQPGYPDVSKVSCTSCSVRGDADVFIVGKNFSGNATVMFKEYGPDGRVVWSAEAPLDQQHVHTCHMICTVPPYKDLYSNKCVEVMMTVECGKKVSRPIAFKYLPDNNVAGANAEAAHQQSAYSNPFDDVLSGNMLEGGGVVSTTTSATNNNVGGLVDQLQRAPPQQQQQQQAAQQQQHQPDAYDSWPTANDFISQAEPAGQQQQQAQPQPQPQQQPPPAPPTVTTNEHQQQQQQQQQFAASVMKPNYVEYIDDSSPDMVAKLQQQQPYNDKQNASFYYSQQTLDKPPPSKRHCGEDALANDPFPFSLDDLPQLLT